LPPRPPGTPKTVPVTGAVHDYILSVSLREPDILRRLRAETSALSRAYMQIAPEQGQFLGLLVELMGARRAIEIGTFTGYSALAIALHLPPDGRLIACDISADWPAIGRPYWEEAGVAERIDLRIAPGLETLDALIAEGGTGTFDFIFIDADKDAYDAYYERALVLLRQGGLIAADNVLWQGKVADPMNDEPATVAIRAFNEMVHGDARVSLSLIPITDGITLARKR
jgi:caffeoyl-CoA O-methyltransferase